MHQQLAVLNKWIGHTTALHFKDRARIKHFVKAKLYFWHYKDVPELVDLKIVFSAHSEYFTQKITQPFDKKCIKHKEILLRGFVNYFANGPKLLKNTKHLKLFQSPLTQAQP